MYILSIGTRNVVLEALYIFGIVSKTGGILIFHSLEVTLVQNSFYWPLLAGIKASVDKSIVLCETIACIS